MTSYTLWFGRLQVRLLEFTSPRLLQTEENKVFLFLFLLFSLFLFLFSLFLFHLFLYLSRSLLLAFSLSLSFILICTILSKSDQDNSMCAKKVHVNDVYQSVVVSIYHNIYISLYFCLNPYDLYL